MPDLSVIDLAMFLLETPERPYNIGPLAIIAPPANFRGNFADKLLERMLERSVGAPFNYRLGRSAAGIPKLDIDDQADARKHVQRLTLDAQASMDELCATVSKLHEVRIDRSGLLWELYVIDGLEGGALVNPGARPVLFPVLAIFDIEDRQPLLDAALRLDGIDLACFVSPNAVDKALSVMLADRAWPASLCAATVGRSSELALARFGVTEVIAPREHFDSEALLELPQLRDMAGKRVIIFRGDGGRELLGDTLRQRGATVEYVTCYRRGRPDLDPAPLLKLWSEGRLDAVTVPSSEGLRNLVDMVGKLGQTCAVLRHSLAAVAG